MINHKITVYTPKFTPITYGPNWNSAPVTRLTQEEYNEVLKTLPFSVGEFVTIGKQRVYRLGAISYVARIQQDATRLTYRGGFQSPPLPMQVIQCSIAEPSMRPYIRWDNEIGYRHLTQDEIEEYIVPNNDKLQDYCKHWTEQAASSTTG